MFESCVEIQSHFSDFVDDLCSQQVRKSIRYHLAFCEPCAQKLDQWQSLRAELRTLPRRQVSPEVALRLRVKLSHLLHYTPLSFLWVRCENALKPLLIPAMGGILTALISFGLFMGSGGGPIANGPDVASQLVTPAHAEELAPMNFNSGDSDLLLVTQISAAGRVKGYQLLSGQSSPELRRNLDRMIYFSKFRPATNFGRPTDGQVVVSLRRITVRG